MPREPQSYGSNQDWVSGKTDQKVNDPKAAPPAEHRAFYDERREAEATSPDQGGKTSDVQLAENLEPRGQGDTSPGDEAGFRVRTATGGAKRDSYFKKRDYE